MANPYGIPNSAGFSRKHNFIERLSWLTHAGKRTQAELWYCKDLKGMRNRTLSARPTSGKVQPKLHPHLSLTGRNSSALIESHRPQSGLKPILRPACSHFLHCKHRFMCKQHTTPLHEVVKGTGYRIPYKAAPPCPCHCPASPQSLCKTKKS